MARIARPQARAEQIQPFTPDQLKALLAAVKRSRFRVRNEAIFFLLLDTGMRAGELCGLKVKDVDPTQRRIEVLGKGNKKRIVYFGRRAARALWAYLRQRGVLDCSENVPLFPACANAHAGEPLTTSGLRQLFWQWGETACVRGRRCSPHTMRHTFAIQFLRNKGNVFALKEMLGHTNLTITNRYVALAEADMEEQHRQYSPADRMEF
jgi:site-specific recombinase XerD